MVGLSGLESNYFRLFGAGSSSYIAVNRASRKARFSTSSTSSISFAPSYKGMTEEEKQWYDKYSNLNVDLAAAAQRAAEASQKNMQDEIDQLTQQANLYFSNNMEEERAEALKRLEGLEDLKAESSAKLQQLRQDIATAKQLQAQQKYEMMQEAADAYAEENPASGEWSAEEIDQKIREVDDRLQLLVASGQNEEADALKVELDRLYQMRSVIEYGEDGERNLYDYLLSQDAETGGEEAKDYLDYLQETMNYRKGMEQVSDIRNIDNDFLRALAIGAHSVGTGMANAGAGYNQLFSEEAIPTTAMQYASEELMGELGTVGRALYSAGSTVGNMLPTILLSAGLGALGVSGAVAGGAASAAMGASAAGSTYTQAVKEGYAPDKAKTYATLVGASEAALQYLLGGIGKLGGVTDDAILAKVKTIDNVLARMALTGAVKIGSEVGEEELQLFLEPAIRSVVFSEDYNVPQMEEIIETAVVSALSTGLLEGPGIISARFEGPDMGSNPVQASEPAVDPVMEQAAEMPKRDGAKKADGEPLANVSEASVKPSPVSSPAKETARTNGTAAAQNAPAGKTNEVKAGLQAAARAFGAEGAKNLMDAYDGNVREQDYLGGFTAFYEAGMSGQSMDAVKSIFNGYLTDNQKQLAYGAGQIDAASSLKAEIGAVASATVYGKEAGLVRNQQAAKLDRSVADGLNRLAKATGVKIQVEELAEGINGTYENGTIKISTKASKPALVVAAHEITHRMQQMSPEAYRSYRDYVVKSVSSEIGQAGLDDIRDRWRSRLGKELTSEQAMDELAADFAMEMVQGEKLFQDFAKEDRTAAQKFVDAVKAFIEKVKAVFGKRSKSGDSAAQNKFGVDLETLENAAQKWEAALEATEEAVKGKENTASEGGEVRYSIDPGFASAVDIWYRSGQEKGEVFVLGSTGPVLQGLGAIESDIYMNGDKISAILEKHSEMTIEEIKRIPEMLEDPVLILKSKNLGRKSRSNTRLVVFGSVKAQNGAPVLAVLDLRPVENKLVIDDMQRVTSAYAKDTNPVGFVRSSEVVHADKKRTIPLLRTIGFRAPIELQRSGSIGSISYEGQNVNISGVGFSDVVSASESERNENRPSIRQTLHADVTSPENGGGNARSYANNISDDTGNDNTVFSLADDSDLNAAEIKSMRQENTMLKERVDYWKGQTKRTTKPTMDKKAVAKAARDLVREYGADVDIAEDLQSLYNDIVSGKDGEKEMTGEAAFRRAADIAKQLVENAVVKDDTMYQDYADLRQYLRSTKLVISESASKDIPDFSDFRKSNMGRINIGKGESNIQAVYQELADQYPEFFDEQRTMAESDQLLEIAEVMGKIYNITEYNPYSRYMEQAVTGTANEILEKFFDLPETKPTFADRQAKAMQDLKDKAGQRLAKERADYEQKLQELRQQNRQKVQDAIRKERDRRVKEVDNLKSQYAARDLKGRERRNARELRAKITRHAKALSQKLLKPTDKQHVPENLRGAVAMLLDAINLESQYTVTLDGKRVKGGDGNPTKRTEAFMRLRQEYEKITKSDQPYNLVIDPDLMDNLVELSEMRDIRLADMNTEQLATVWAALRAVEASIQTANKAFGASRFETISEFAEGIRTDNHGRNDRGNLRSGIPDKMDKLVNVDMLTPEAYFHRLGGTASEIFRMLRNAQDQHIRIMEKAKRATFKITRSSNIEKLEKEIHHVKLSGDRTVTMSTAQIMSLYELLKREQAQDHILVGGIRPDALEQKGLKQVNRAEPYQVTLEDCMEICGVLTKEQQEMADKLQQYLGNELSELGNQASMEVYGYRKFNETNYFPIKVDQNQTKSDVAKQAQAATIAGRGFTKATAPNAMVNDEQAYRIIVADMVRNGMSVEDIRKAMEDRMKKAQGVQSVGELANRYLTPEQTKVYDSMHSGVSGTTVWNEATAEQRAKAEEHMYNVVVGNDDGLRLQEKIAAGAEIGLTETEYILYQLAKEVVGDGNNNTSQDEAKMAIDMLTGLTDEERAYLWASTNKGWKPENNPYK